MANILAEDCDWNLSFDCCDLSLGWLHSVPQARLQDQQIIKSFIQHN